MSAKYTSKKDIYSWILDGLKAKQSTFSIDEATLRSYAGKYGERKLFFENGSLFYQKDGSEKAKLNAIDNDTFTIEGIDYLRLKIIKENGKITALLRFYNDGI